LINIIQSKRKSSATSAFKFNTCILVKLHVACMSCRKAGWNKSAVFTQTTAVRNFVGSSVQPEVTIVDVAWQSFKYRH